MCVPKSRLPVSEKLLWTCLFIVRNLGRNLCSGLKYLWNLGVRLRSSRLCASASGHWASRQALFLFWESLLTLSHRLAGNILCSPGWPWTFVSSSASVSGVLGLQAQATLPVCVGCCLLTHSRFYNLHGALWWAGTTNHKGVLHLRFVIFIPAIAVCIVSVKLLPILMLWFCSMPSSF